MFNLQWLSIVLIFGAVISMLFMDRMRYLWIYPWTAGMGVMGVHYLQAGATNRGILYLAGGVGLLLLHFVVKGKKHKRDNRSLQEKLREVEDRRNKNNE